MKTIAAKKIGRTFLLMLMIGFMSLMLSSASSKKNVSAKAPEVCYYLLKHVIGGPGSQKTVPLFVRENRLEFHLAHGDTYLDTTCYPNIGDLVSDHTNPGGGGKP